MSTADDARAVDFEERTSYVPEIRPGYTAWVSLFAFGNGDLGAAFSEIRRGSNPDFQPPPLEFVEAMGICYRESPDLLPCSNRDLISEYVSLRSVDAGETWQETGRCAAATRHYWYTGFPDGRLVRVIATQHYRHEVGDERLCNVMQESTDGGNTWTEIARIMQDVFFYIHKFRKMPSGALIALGPILPSFGPGTARAGRLSTIPDHVLPDQSAFLVSNDRGHTWDGPHYVLSGVEGWEPDVVELPDGDLLFVNSTVQTGRPVRQTVRRTVTGFVNGPLLAIGRGAPTDANVQGGYTPETIAINPDGLLVGARRGSVYSCSNDLGANWSPIADAPDCHYQPMIEWLPDGRFLAAWHFGMDSRFGEIDMYIGTHAFQVDANLPSPSRLSLERELAADGSRYGNRFRVVLTADGQPQAGREVELHVKDVWLPQPVGQRNTVDVYVAPETHRAVTDVDGAATFPLPAKDAIPDIHHGYRVAAVFLPESGDSCAACRSPSAVAYAMTPASTSTAPYPVYLNHGLVMIRPDVLEQYPELPRVVAAFVVPDPDTDLAHWIEVVGDPERAEAILGFLLEYHVLQRDDDGIYHWYRSVHSGGSGEPWIHELRVCELEEHCG